MTVKEVVERRIREYFRNTFGREDVLPNVAIEGLAEKIEEYADIIYRIVDEEKIFEDIDYVADEIGVELSDEERGDAFYRYAKIKDNDDSIQYLFDTIRDIVGEREK